MREGAKLGARPKLGNGDGRHGSRGVMVRCEIPNADTAAMHQYAAAASSLEVEHGSGI